METKTFEHILKEKLGNSGSINGFGARSKDYPLHKAVVDHNQDRIKTRQGRKISDEVDGELAEGERSGGWDGMESRRGGVSINLVLLADCTAIDKVFDKGGKTGPPVVMFKGSLGAEDIHMTREGRGMNSVE